MNQTLLWFRKFSRDPYQPGYRKMRAIGDRLGFAAGAASVTYKAAHSDPNSPNRPLLRLFIDLLSTDRMFHLSLRYNAVPISVTDFTARFQLHMGTDVMAIISAKTGLQNIKHLVLGLIAIAAVGVVPQLSTPASAQGCPAGIPSGGNPNCIPPDVYNGSSGGTTSSDGGPPLYQTWQAGHSAIAFHPDSTQVWSAWNMIDQKDGEARVMAACNQVMGGGCQLGLSSIGGTIVVGRGSNGYIQAAWGNKKKDAVKVLNEACAKENIDCVVERTITSTHIKRPAMVLITVRQEVDLPETPGLARFGAVASLSVADAERTGWVGRAWLVTGEPTWAAATDKALARCRSATGLQCELDTHGVNTNIMRYAIGTDGFSAWSTALTRKDADASVSRKCKKHFKGKKCAVAALYDTKAPRDELIEF